VSHRSVTVTAMAEPTDTDGTAAWAGDGAGDGETAVVPPIPTAAPELAWSAEDETEEIQRQSWRLTWGRAAVLILSAAALAGIVGLIGWAIRPSKDMRPPAAVPAITPAPPAATTTAALPRGFRPWWPSAPGPDRGGIVITDTPLPTTSAVQESPQRAPIFNDGDGAAPTAPPSAVPGL
jgi:hypothetical protein